MLAWLESHVAGGRAGGRWGGGGRSEPHPGACGEAWLSSERLRGDLERLDHVLAGLPGQGTEAWRGAGCGVIRRTLLGSTETPEGSRNSEQPRNLGPGAVKTVEQRPPTPLDSRQTGGAVGRNSGQGLRYLLDTSNTDLLCRVSRPPGPKLA